MRFDLNGLVALEQRFGTVQRAVDAVKRNKRVADVVWAFTRSLTPALTEDEIRQELRDKAAEVLCRKQIIEGFMLPYGAGLTLGPADLPEQYRSLKVTAAVVEIFNQRFPEEQSRHPAAALRYAVWACLAETSPGLTEEAVGQDISPLHVGALLEAHTQAVRNWARENGIAV